MRMRVWTSIFALMAGTALMTGPVAATAQDSSQPQPMGGMSMDRSKSMPSPPPSSLKITFADKSAAWTPATLAALPHQTVTVYNEHAKVKQSYSGVPLIDLLKQLGVPAKPEGKQLRLYLVAAGSDGYEVVFSLAEIAPEYHESNLIVADTMEGKPLPDSIYLQLIGTGDKGLSRSVRSLASIRVLKAE